MILETFDIRFSVEPLVALTRFVNRFLATVITAKGIPLSVWSLDSLADLRPVQPLGEFGITTEARPVVWEMLAQRWILACNGKLGFADHVCAVTTFGADVTGVDNLGYCVAQLDIVSLQCGPKAGLIAHLLTKASGTETGHPKDNEDRFRNHMLPALRHSTIRHRVNGLGSG